MAQVSRLCDSVRAGCAAIAARARSVTIDLEALEQLEVSGAVELNPHHHFVDGTPDEVADYVLCLDSINFGSGWFPTLRKPAGLSGYATVASALAARWRAGGAWTARELASIETRELAATLGQAADHELMALYTQALRQLGTFLGDRRALDLVDGGSAERLAAELASGMTMFADAGFYKRAQIVTSDLALAGVASFEDLDRLTIFADNLVPHVLRCDGVLRYDERLAAHIDAGRPLRPGPQEKEIRACAVRACELLSARLGLAEHALDNLLWNRGQGAAYKARPRHRCRTIWY